ncbi:MULTISPECIES: RNA polymerase factor sigma-54 [Aerococcus]|uniref:RNA polymerase factor sigma-54 n=1 Tax=Aerococcus loyolae TaxID=2976809 RepID=A0ABT4BXP9_9LACT|nr:MULTISPECIES: RNA polymerase factor sigma-54 [Aerococcus]KAA9220696.1 RNA polymerase factor sigma-54 [Aerococcus loyolae]KAA9265417.1 RNA polymerase factor sigma-54 [Aerococcus loyolae]MCY3025044.1 RNA polymerase factor sigma-54 [Aerococcus loyolae]MCY3026899.1 RNA polymerase factor sigma-54 [Aerococcus loyolae]MCY3028484.1 RNA polymerase factor sigma-54 [Aerococcus loyolae]
MAINYHTQQNIQEKLTPYVKNQLVHTTRLLQKNQVDLVTELKNYYESNPFIEISENQQVQSTFTHEASDYSIADTLADPNALSLDEYLIQQVSEMSLSAHEKRQIAYLIGQLDQDGYYRKDDHATCQLFAWSQAELESYLSILQSLEPKGIAARNLQECLALQVKALPDGQLVETLINDHLEDLAQGNFEKIAQQESMPLDQVKASLIQIQSLEPRPARNFSHDIPAYTLPDIIVKAKNGEVSFQVSKDYLPQISFKQDYYQAMQSQSADEETLAYLKEKKREFDWLVFSLKKRDQLLLKISQYLVQYQATYLNQQENQLRPLSQKELAQALNYDESTISRAIMDKYLQYNQRILSFHDLLAKKVSVNGQALTRQQAEKFIRQIIDQEYPHHPLSDQAISDHLALHNYYLARRTVAKYRQAMGIPGARRRKREKFAQKNKDKP